MASSTSVHQQVVIGGGSHSAAHRRQTRNKLRHGQLELADQHAAGGGNREAGAPRACGQRKSQIGHQQALAHFGFAAHKQNALRRQQSRFDPAGRRRVGLLGEQLRQRNHGGFRRVLGGRVFHSSASEVASSSNPSFTSCILREAAMRSAVNAS